MTFVNNIEVRHNPKTGRLQYRCRYDLYKNEKRSRRRTGWCSTEEAARHEAERKKAELSTQDKKEARRQRDKAISTYMDEYVEWIKQRPLDDSFSASERRSVLTRMVIIKRVVKTANLTAGNIDERDIHLWGTQLAEYVSPKTGKVISTTYYNLLAIETNKFLDWLNEHLKKPLPATARIPRRKKGKTHQDPHSPTGDKWSYYKYVEWLLLAQKCGFKPSDISLEGFTEPLRIDQLLTAKQYGFLILNFLYYEGTRSEEMRELRWKDISFTEHSISIERASNYRILAQDRETYNQIKATKNQASARKIPLYHSSTKEDPYQNIEAYLAVLFNAQTIGMKDAQMRETMLDRLVFPSREHPDREYTPHSVDRWLRLFAEETGLKRVNVHGLRHSFAEYQAKRRHMPKEILKDLMGHVDEDMLRLVYLTESQNDKFDRIMDWESKQSQVKK